MVNGSSAFASTGQTAAWALSCHVPILLQKSGKKKEACPERRSLSIALAPVSQTDAELQGLLPKRADGTFHCS